MATKYKTVKPDSHVLSMAAQVLNKFNDELGHINLDDIQFAWRISKASRYHGKTRLIRGEHKMFTDKKVCMVLWLHSWKERPKAWRYLLLYHELRHIAADDKDEGDYRIYHHDLEDFADIVATYGVRWEKANLFLDKLNGGK